MNIAVNNRIKELRAAMKLHQIDAFIIPSSDPHQSEYAADHWNARAWISGFTGSAGTVVITATHAGLWTDSRYFIQAEQELADSEIELHRLGVPHTAEHLSWITQHLDTESTVGIDGACFSVGQVRTMAKQFYSKKINIKSDVDLIQKVWKDRPALPTHTVLELGLEYTGKSRPDKIKEICDTIVKQDATQHLVTTLDDIAWIFNIRSKDVKCNPVSIAYAIIAPQRTILFINPDKISADLKATFQSEQIHIKPYESIHEYLSNLDTSERILIDLATINNQLYNLIPEDCIVKGTTVSTALKACKNKTEIQNIRKAMIKDGVALTKLYRWLDAELDKRGVTEVEVSNQLHQFRKDQGHFFGDSFDAIVGYKGNGAIVHYRPEEATCATLAKDGILLLDSGGQYLEGTTDITRTTALGTPTAEQKRNFTLVLKGHIGIDQLKFPKGTKGSQMDILARQYLWKHGLNYGHGTGHGVGYFLNVHEGPQSISPVTSGKATTPFEVGMFTSNEPGFYKEGEYGIRIENLVLTVEGEQTDYGQFLEFETMTLFPIDQSLIDTSLLTRNEINWINDYHTKVEKILSPHLNAEEQAWMKEQCKVIT